ncbi:MAG: 50S ribosomal protein L17 [Bacteroidetes bacterium]|nr:50S ribosomal protein L17 [Bacteroidota bacterium]
MRHGNKINHLGRKYGHRDAMLSNMASSLIRHKRIFTTTAKAKELRVYIEPLLTKAKNDTTHSRRVVFSYLQDKESVKELFGTVAEKIADRPGGYTRILKTHNRKGDNAEMCMMELVDFNELMLDQKSASTSTTAKTRRSRRSGGTKKVEAAANVEKTVDAVAEAAEDISNDAADEASEETK